MGISTKMKRDLVYYSLLLIVLVPLIPMWYYIKGQKSYVIAGYSAMFSLFLLILFIMYKLKQPLKPVPAIKLTQSDIRIERITIGTLLALGTLALLMSWTGGTLNFVIIIVAVLFFPLGLILFIKPDLLYSFTKLGVDMRLGKSLPVNQKKKELKIFIIAAIILMVIMIVLLVGNLMTY